MQRLLIAAGLLIAVAGLLWPWLSKLPLGRLPGDIVVDRPGAVQTEIRVGNVAIPRKHPDYTALDLAFAATSGDPSELGRLQDAMKSNDPVKRHWGLLGMRVRVKADDVETGGG